MLRYVYQNHDAIRKHNLNFQSYQVTNSLTALKNPWRWTKSIMKHVLTIISLFPLKGSLRLKEISIMLATTLFCSPELLGGDQSGSAPLTTRRHHREGWQGEPRVCQGREGCDAVSLEKEMGKKTLITTALSSRRIIIIIIIISNIIISLKAATVSEAARTTN